MTAKDKTTVEHLLSISPEAQSDLLTFMRRSARKPRGSYETDDDYILKIIALHKSHQRRRTG